MKRGQASSVVTAAVLGVAALLAASCKSEEPAKSEPAKAEAPVVAGFGFDKMTHEERGRFMKETVLPRMKAAFSAFDAHEFGEMNCRTCHGPGAKDKTFKMPNPKLPKLPTDEAGWAALEKKEPEAMKFMKETVVPQMAALLGEKPYDPATHEGFGCFECHTARTK